MSETKTSELTSDIFTVNNMHEVELKGIDHELDNTQKTYRAVKRDYDEAGNSIKSRNVIVKCISTSKFNDNEIKTLMNEGRELSNTCVNSNYILNMLFPIKDAHNILYIFEDCHFTFTQYIAKSIENEIDEKDKKNENTKKIQKIKKIKKHLIDYIKGFQEILNLGFKISTLEPRNFVVREIKKQVAVLFYDLSIKHGIESENHDAPDKNKQKNELGYEWTTLVFMFACCLYKIFTNKDLFPKDLNLGSQKDFCTYIDKEFNQFSQSNIHSLSSSDIRLFKDLISKMTRFSSGKRISLDKVLIHPFFLDQDIIEGFLIQLRSTVGGNKKWKKNFNKMLKNKFSQSPRTWHDRISNKMLKSFILKNFITRIAYSTDAFGLLISIRNFLVHFDDSKYKGFKSKKDVIESMDGLYEEIVIAAYEFNSQYDIIKD